MKKLLCLALALTLALGLVACGGTVDTSDKDYAQILAESRSAEDNENIAIVTTPEEDAFGLMELYGLDPAQMERFAVSISPVNMVAHAVMIVQPTAEGKEDVRTAMQSFIQQQCSTFEDYLPDQYEIAQAAKLVDGPGGELILVMSADADAILEHIQSALNA